MIKGKREGKRSSTTRQNSVNGIKTASNLLISCFDDIAIEKVSEKINANPKDKPSWSKSSAVSPFDSAIKKPKLMAVKELTQNQKITFVIYVIG